VQQALSALLSKYLECVVAAEQTELESFFGKICGAVAREGICECAAGGARVEFCAREWTVDAADYAGEGSGGSICSYGSNGERRKADENRVRAKSFPRARAKGRLLRVSTAFIHVATFRHT